MDDKNKKAVRSNPVIKDLKKLSKNYKSNMSKPYSDKAFKFLTTPPKSRQFKDNEVNNG